MRRLCLALAEYNLHQFLGCTLEVVYYKDDKRNGGGRPYYIVDCGGDVGCVGDDSPSKLCHKLQRMLKTATALAVPFPAAPAPEEPAFAPVPAPAPASGETAPVHAPAPAPAPAPEEIAPAPPPLVPAPTAPRMPLPPIASAAQPRRSAAARRKSAVTPAISRPPECAPAHARKLRSSARAAPAEQQDPQRQLQLAPLGTLPPNANHAASVNKAMESARRLTRQQQLSLLKVRPTRE